MPTAAARPADATPAIPEATARIDASARAPAQAPGASPRTTAASIEPHAGNAAAPAPPAAALASADVAPSPPSPTLATEALPRLSDLDSDARRALPPLKLSMHMWNEAPAQRFVIIDGNRVGIGGRVGEVEIADIVADGVVLDWHGRRIKLPLR